MRALILPRYGAGAKFEMADLPTPALSAGHALVRVVSAGVNPIDCKLRRNGGALAPSPPAILGSDFAGVVEEVAPDVTTFSTGDEVYGCAGGVAGMPGGSLAELMAADVRLMARKPQRLTFREAAALPLVVITAKEGLERAVLKPGQRLLVLGGAGGVGHVAVQLGKHHGAHVTATAQEAKAGIAAALGADAVIGHHDFDTSGYDIVFDAAGQDSIEPAVAAVKNGGHVIAISGRAGQNLQMASRKGLTLHFVFMILPMLTGEGRAEHHRMLTEVARIADAGALRALVDPRRFSWETADDAYDLVEARGASGKVVIDLDPDRADLRRLKY
ncbi:MAG: zinc-binding dehydrogenase [Parvularculaceae bacterium]|nr:zinc-binding dehydrogenase [Parvularculaceae bacterium]